MTTQPLYFGGEMDAFIPSDNSVVETASGTRYNTTYSRCAIQVPPGSSVKSWRFASQTGAVYIHAAVSFAPGNSGEETLWTVLDSTGVVVAKLTMNRNSGTTNLVKTYVLTSAPSTFTQVGSGVSVNSAAVQVIDLLLDKTNGQVTLWVADSQQDHGSVSFAAVTNMAQVSHNAGVVTAATAWWSQMFASTSPTVGQRLQTLVEDTVGAATDWTGPIGNVNELVYNDGLGITATTNGNTNTYKIAAPSIIGTVLGVGTSARFNVQATGPQNIQNVLRVSGSNYNSGSTAGAVGFAPAQYMWMTNPATSAAWTTVGAGGSEWGVEAIT